MSKASRIALICLLLLPPSCRPALKENLPLLTRRNEPAELKILQDRAAQLKDISGSGTLALVASNGNSVVFDLAVAMQPPDHARFRAWKIGQAVLDLTVLPNAVWLETSQQGDRKAQLSSLGNTADQVTKALSFLGGGFFDDPELIGKDAGDQLILTQQKPGEAVITCTVDRPTLSPRQFRMTDAKGVQRFTLSLEDFTEIKGAIWPRKITAVSSFGTVTVILDDVDLNAGLPAGAFVPPNGAEKLP